MTRIEPIYRVYRLNDAGGFIGAIVLASTGDTDAIAEARAIAMDHAVELWDRARFVARLAPDAGMTATSYPARREDDACPSMPAGRRRA